MFRIRQASKEDCSVIKGFQCAMALETENLALNDSVLTEGVKAVFALPSRGKYYVCEHQGEVVASLLITYEWSDWRNCDVWWFQSVYVIPAFRRMGIFRQMYSFIKEEAIANGAGGLRLYVESNNSPARNTYEALGMSSEHYTMYEWLRTN